jgi:hypothetical protein
MRRQPISRAPVRIRPTGAKRNKGRISIRVPTAKKSSPRVDSTKPILSETGEVLFRGTETQWRGWVRKRKENGSYDAELLHRYRRPVF